MARRHGLYRNLRTIAGMALIALGLFILFENMTDAAARLTGFIGGSADATQTIGDVAAVGLGASRVVQCYLFDRVGFARSACKILISLWPLCLVTVGAVLTSIASQTNSKNIQNKIQDVSI
jgi:uncharacterized membrane protein